MHQVHQDLPCFRKLWPSGPRVPRRTQCYMVHNGHHSRGQGNDPPTHPNYYEHVEAIETGREYHLAKARFGRVTINEK
jgi:hypothetical protein